MLHVTDSLAEIKATAIINSDQKQNIKVEIKYDSKYLLERECAVNKGENKISWLLNIKNPILWWPNGMGEQYRGVFSLGVVSRSGFCVNESFYLGLRDLKVIRNKDSLGRSFYVEVNGRKVFIKGANYIPQDNFQSNVNNQRYENIISSAAAANMNMLRVWGGGIYENDEFYELCDKYGILVWQELMFACGMYPSDDGFLENVKAEINDNVKRIRNHSCLALYCGNNENEVSWYSWGWKQKYTPEVQAEYENNMKKLFYETIPSVLSRCDSTRYYHYSSPSAGFNGKGNDEGDIHYWGVWHAGIKLYEPVIT